MMACLTKAFSMALVAVILIVFCIQDSASAKLVPFSAKHTHSRIRRSLLSKRSAADCPNGTVASTVQDQIGKLSSASAHHGGQLQTKDITLPSDGGSTKVHVQAQSDQSGKSRSWSWSWSSHTSSSSSSSFSSSSSSSSSSKSSSSSSKSSSSSSKPSSSSSKSSASSPHNDSDETSDGDTDDNNNNDKDTHSIPTAKYGDLRPAKSNQDQESVGRYQRGSLPQSGIVRVETKSNHTSHHSSSRHQTTTTTEEKDGKMIRHVSKTDSSSSSSSSSYSQFSNVFHYVISGNAQKSNNPAPFMDASVQWTRSPMFEASFSVNSASGPHIPRPAKANVCNQKFPFTGQQYTASDTDPRFTKSFPREALDPVSKVALDLHNAERERYGLPLLQWNADLANMASCWADLKAYGHSEDHFCVSGENIAMGNGDPCYSNPMQGMKNGIYSFLDEDRNWARNPHESEDNGHWTQIVWKETRFVGCAVSQRMHFADDYSPSDGQASMYVVCEYYPPGNVQGEFERQVPIVHPTPQLRSSCSANERHGG